MALILSIFVYVIHMYANLYIGISLFKETLMIVCK